MHYFRSLLQQSGNMFGVLLSINNLTHYVNKKI